MYGSLIDHTKYTVVISYYCGGVYTRTINFSNIYIHKKKNIYIYILLLIVLTCQFNNNIILCNSNYNMYPCRLQKEATFASVLYNATILQIVRYVSILVLQLIRVLMVELVL